MPRGRRRRRRAIVNPLVLVAASLIVLVQSALPPGQEDEIIVIDHLPGRRVHLQDFFWTGAEDAPAWLDPDQMLTIYETRTVHHTATLYVPEDTSRGPGDPSDARPRPTVDCASCIEPTATYSDVDQNIGVLVDGDDPGPRYWLLTVLQAGEEVPPKVELRLARLYKAAFTRQQQKHLGLLGSDTRKRKSAKREALVDNGTAVRIPNRPVTNANLTLAFIRKCQPDEAATASANDTGLPAAAGRRSPSATPLLRMRPVRISGGERTPPLREGQELEQLALGAAELSGTNEAHAADKARLVRPREAVGLVQVRMQNTSRAESGAMRLIYTVHLGGKPVPAETAAKDMALLSSQEVALELGAPVIIPSEPYLKESRPLALSRKRDAWLLIGATSLGLLLIGLVVLALFVLAKRKRAQSAVSVPTRNNNRRVLVKDEEYAPTTPGIDNTAYTSDTDPRTEVAGRTPGSQDSMEADPRGEISSENEVDQEHHRRTASQQQARAWDSREYAEIESKGAPRNKRGQQQRPQSGDSVDSVGMLAGGALGGRDSNARASASAEEEEAGASGSPHSYLSMPSCKQFPNMRSVEPLSKVLEPVVVKHLDLELDSPEMKIKQFDFAERNGDNHFARSASDTKDPGVLGPIVWDMKRKRAVEDGRASTEAREQLGPGRVPHGPVGRARRRLNELLEDSFSLFGARDSKPPAAAATATSQRGLPFERRAQPGISTGQGSLHHSTPRTHCTAASSIEHRGKSAHVSHVTPPNADGQHRPRTSLPDGAAIPETGHHLGPQPRGAWGSRPLSAGPFHRPSLPGVEVSRILTDSQLRPEDPAVPLISAIKKELGRFTCD